MIRKSKLINVIFFTPDFLIAVLYSFHTNIALCWYDVKVSYTVFYFQIVSRLVYVL